VNSPQDTADIDRLRADAEAWQKAKPILQSLVALDPRCAPVLVGLARNLLQEAM
jgi:hypothetical protein